MPDFLNGEVYILTLIKAHPKGYIKITHKIMSYSQYDKHGKLISHNDLQAKIRWCKNGEKIEEAFVSIYGSELDLIINPEKLHNPYAPDLLYNNSQLADLKAQNTPFFKAERLFNLDPSYVVVFNKKDALRYGQKYPEIMIYFWVEWHSVKFVMGRFIKEVEYVNGVWRIDFKDLFQLLRNAPQHDYQQRRNDQLGNAKSSYVLDLRNPKFIKVG